MKEGEGDFWVPDGDTEAGDSVLELITQSEVVTDLQPLAASENLLAEKKLGLEFLKHGELGGTGGLGSWRAGL